jgi:hypothetical protein
MPERDCPFKYWDEVAISYDADFCKLDDKRCIGDNCTVWKAICVKKGIAPSDSKNFNKGQFLGPHGGK